MQSSAHKALASLQRKYQALICQHGSSKKCLAVADADITFLRQRIQALYHVTGQLQDKVVYRDKTIESLEFDLRSARIAVEHGVKGFISREDYARLEAKHRVAESEASLQRGQVEGWKHFSIIVSLLSAVAGAGVVYGLGYFGIL